MKKIYLSILLLLSLAVSSQSQIRFGIEGGANMTYVSIGGSSGSVGGASVDYKTTPDIGFRAGALIDYRMSDNLAVQVGAFYNRIAYKYKYTFSIPGASGSTDFDVSVAENFVRVPVNVVFRTGGFFVNGGAFLGYGINGTIKTNEVSSSFSFTDNGGSAIAYGAQAGLGYELPMGLFIHAGYELTLGSVKTGTVGSVTDNVMSVSLGYLFGGGGSSGGGGGGEGSGKHLPKPWNRVAFP